MKFLILSALLALGAGPAQAAFTYCQKIGGACGEDYTCELVGWAHSEPYCSVTDQSTRPVRKVEIPSEQSCNACRSQPQPSEFCQEECGCEKSAFCGMW